LPAYTDSYKATYFSGSTFTSWQDSFYLPTIAMPTATVTPAALLEELRGNPWRNPQRHPQDSPSQIAGRVLAQTLLSTRTLAEYLT
jgi:hypothetical protein